MGRPAYNIIFAVCLMAVLFVPGKSLAYEIGNVDIQITGKSQCTYDDNITYLPYAAKSDFITDLRLGLDVGYEGKRQAMGFAGDINQSIFGNYNEFNNTSENFDLYFKKEISAYERLSLKNSFTHAEEPRSFEDAFGRTGGRYSYIRDRAGIDYARDISRQFTFCLRGGVDSDQYAIKDLSDSMQYRIGASADYILNSSNIFSLAYDYFKRDFAPGGDASTQVITSGIRHYVTVQLYGELKSGVSIIKSYGREDYTKPMITALLVDEVDKNTRAAIEFRKQYQTNASAQDVFNSWQAAASISRQLNGRVGLFFSGFYGKGEYVVFGVEDKLRGANLGFSYEIKQNITGSLSYAYSKTDSNISGREYIKNVIFGSIEVRF